MRAGWASDLCTFLDEPTKTILAQLTAHHDETMGHPVSKQQVSAWLQEIDVLKSSINVEAQLQPSIRIILEYEIPRERGRKPDVIILTGSKILILEFKSGTVITQADIDQANLYARDLGCYHSVGNQLNTDFCVVATNAELKHPSVIPANTLGNWLNDRLSQQPGVSCDEWLRGEYSPLPDLVEAARSLFHGRPLPSVKTAQSAGIPDAKKELLDIAFNAKLNNSRVLVIVRGVPGAGKSLLGLDFVHQNITTEGFANALFLSGNGPLVNVLKDALQSSIFVQDVHGFLREYDRQDAAIPHENILVFDEAQRAWDADQVYVKRKIHRSEPESFLKIGSKMNWSVLVALVGSGQEIYKGEEEGISQWAAAIEGTDSNWKVVCPPSLRNHFQSVADTKASSKLDLDYSLRSHQAINLHAWVNAVLDGDGNSAKQISKDLRSSSFQMYITRNLEDGKEYVRRLYAATNSIRYGVIASSEAQYLAKHNLDISFASRRKINYAKWFNTAKGSGNSCCDFKAAATEFECQGLELDMPLIAWARDLLWDNAAWKADGRNSKNIKNPRQLTLNTYRVLLTRGRDGFVVFLPGNPLASSTYEFLKSSGLEDLPNGL